MGGTCVCVGIGVWGGVCGVDVWGVGVQVGYLRAGEWVCVGGVAEISTADGGHGGRGPVEQVEEEGAADVAGWVR